MSYPLTSIIILTKNNVQFTERCINSIHQYVNRKAAPYEIMVLDENSFDGTKELCEKYGIYYENVPQLNSFAKRNNYAATKAKGKFLWFLNNDTELINDNLLYMLRHFANLEIGAVGSKHIFPDGSLNHIGMAIDKDLNPVHIYPNEDPTLPYINHGRFIELMTSASIIFRRDVYEKLKGYDESYSWGFEDVDIMLRLQELGYKAYCDNDATMIHFGQSTYGRTARDEENKAIFMSKWKDKLVPNIDQLYSEKEAYLKKTNINPKKMAKKYGKSILRRIQSDQNTLPESQLPYSPVYVFKSKNFSAFRKIADDISEVIESYIEFDDFNKLENANNQGKSSILISTSHFFEEYMVPAPDWVRDYRTFAINYERISYDKPDYWTESLKHNNIILLAASNYCRDFLINSGVEKDRIFTVHHGYKRQILEHDFNNEIHSLKDKVTAFIVINTNDESRYGTNYLSEALKILKETEPEILENLKLLIKNYGGQSTEAFFITKEYLEIKNLGVEIEYIDKFLSDDDFANLYYRADFFIAPFRGEGFGMKIIDAAAAGLPIISPFYGGPKDYLKFSEHIPVKYTLIPVSEGIDRDMLLLDDTYRWAEVDSKDLAKQIAYTIKNIDSLRESALEKREEIRKKFSWAEAWKKILEIDKKLIESENTKKDFEFFDADFIYDKSTGTHKKLIPEEIEQTAIINTIRIDNLRKTLEHIDAHLDISELKGEILVIDDASESEPDSLLEEFNHLPIRYMKYKDWGGSGFARDVGLRYAKGDNIIILGDDIKPMPGLFLGHYNFYKTHPEPYTLVGHVEWDSTIRNNPVAEFATKISEFQFGFELVRNQTKIDYTKVVTPNLSFRKSDIVKLKQNFKTGIILYEDTIWAKELEEKGVQHYYSRKIYALHNHKIKEEETWLDWFTKRSFAIGNTLRGYTINPAKYNEFMHIEDVINDIRTIYSNTELEKLYDSSSAFDTYLSATTQLLKELIIEDEKITYNKTLRKQIQDMLGNLFVVNWVYGIVLALNPSQDTNTAKGIAFSYMKLHEEKVEANRSITLYERLGMRDSLKLFIKRGRTQYPVVFEPLFRILKSNK